MVLETISALGLILFLCKYSSPLLYYTYHKRKWLKAVGKCFEIARPFSLLASPQTTKYSHVMLGRNLKDLKTVKEKREEAAYTHIRKTAYFSSLSCQAHIKNAIRSFQMISTPKDEQGCKIISLTKSLELCECSSWFSVVCYKPLWYSRLDITHLN